MNKGILYGVGVGPGDPELLTRKAARIIRACDVIAIPHRDPDKCFAYAIATEAVREAKDKPVLCVDMPMTRDKTVREAAYEAGAEALKAVLSDGKDVVFVTLGDPSVYSTFAYLAAKVERGGYEVRWVPGVTSFCAAAAALKQPLCTDREQLHLIPGGANAEEALALSGTKAFMKGELLPLLNAIKERGYSAGAVENCGTENERVYRSEEEIPSDAGYYLVTIVKEKNE
jgi:precorrin-2/cobalt-factor-2 C20-methyltransferase